MAEKRLKATLILTAVDDMTRKIQEMTARSTASLRRIEERATRVGQSAGRIGAVMAFGMGMGIKAAADMERLQVALQTAFQGNQEAADAAFKSIIDFAAKTPFAVDEVMRSFIKLKNMGLDPSERALEAYGNTASAMGKSLNDMVEAVADAATGEFERLKEFGIKASSEGDRVTFTFRGVKTTIRKEAEQIERYLMRVGLTDFAGGIEKQSQTLYGKLSTLRDNATMVAATFGTVLIPAINDVFDSISPALGRIEAWAKANPELTKTIVGVAAGLTLLTIGVSAAAFMVSGLAKTLIGLNVVLAFTAKHVGFALFALRYHFVVSLVPALVAAKTAVLAFSAALWANPITWVVAAVIALAASVYLIYQNWTPISEFFIKLWDGIRAKFAEFLAYVAGIGSAFYEAGANIVDSLKAGIAAKWDSFTAWWSTKIQGIRDFLPFSPAKVGPLRDLHRIRIVETIAEGIKPAPIFTAMRRVALAASIAAPSIAAPAMGAGGGPLLGGIAGPSTVGQALTVNYSPQITIAGPVTAAVQDQFAAELARHKNEIVRIIREEEQRRKVTRF
jgi:hypothetical protein